jgi:hypothetical protein
MVAQMDDRAGNDEDHPLSMQLDLYLDRRPISGRLRTEWGAEERFEGWLGFVDALKRLQEQQAPSADRASGRHTPGDAATTESPPHRKELP